eukprot:350136-Chlamydomonas_euryale.AAC.14
MPHYVMDARDSPVSHYEPQTRVWGRPCRGLSAAVTVGGSQSPMPTPISCVCTRRVLAAPVQAGRAEARACGTCLTWKGRGARLRHLFKLGGQRRTLKARVQARLLLSASLAALTGCSSHAALPSMLSIGADVESAGGHIKAGIA